MCCMYVYMYVCVVCMYICMYVCMSVCIAAVSILLYSLYWQCSVDTHLTSAYIVTL